MKPSWNDAPEWANYLAMDSDNDWYWYESKPHYYYGRWTCESYQRSSRANIDDKSYSSSESLEERPKFTLTGRLQTEDPNIQSENYLRLKEAFLKFFEIKTDN